MYMYFHCFNISQPVTGGDDPPPVSKDYQDSQSHCVNQCHKEPVTCDPPDQTQIYSSMWHGPDPEYKYTCGKNSGGKEESDPACGVWTGFCSCWKCVSKFPINLKESPTGIPAPPWIIYYIIIKFFYLNWRCIIWTSICSFCSECSNCSRYNHYYSFRTFPR